jgi:hypothetical protein
VATVQRAAAPEASRRSGRTAIAVGVAIAMVGIGTGWALSSRTQPAPAATAAQTPNASGMAVVAPSAAAAVSVVVEATPAPPATGAAQTPTAAPQPTATTVATHAAAAAASKSSADPGPATHPATRGALPGGFSDPLGPDGPPKPTQWKVQDHHIRLFSQLVSNGSNVADGVVRKAVEWDAWQYLRCYERTFSGAKDLSEGTVTVGFDILDQLPRHAALVSSTFPSKSFNDCVVGTLLGQTINAAGPDGAGHVVVAFRFVPMN